MEDKKPETNDDMVNKKKDSLLDHDTPAELDEATDLNEHHENPEEAAALADLEEEEHEKFDNASLDHLQEVLASALKEERIKEFRKPFGLIKKRFQELFDEEKHRILQKFLDEGEKAEDFQFYPPEEMIAVRDLINRFKDRLTDIRKREEQELQANFLAKQDLIHELKLLISEESDIKKAFEKFHEIRERWTKIGAVPAQHANELWNNFKFFTDKFYEFVQINRELYEMDLTKNLDIKQQLISRVQALTKVPSIKKSIETLHLLQKEWRETGPVPKNNSREIFDQFKAAVDSVYLRRDSFIKEREESRQKNLTAKTAICEKAEAIGREEVKNLSEWKKKEAELKKLDEEWKGIGRVPIQFNDSIWERFKAARREFYKLKLPLLKHIKDELGSNYEAKVKLCEQAEAIQDNTDWKNTTAKLIQLQSDWKKLGPVERKKSDEIWSRFRAACDHFFNAKEKHFAGQGEREQENLARKKEIIRSIKEYNPVESLDDNLAFIKEAQGNWSEAGYVPIGEKNSIEKEYEAAIDDLLTKLNIDKDKKHRMEYKLKLDTIMHSPQAERLLKDERSYVGNKIRKLEEEITQIENNLGFFGHSKGADAFKKQYEDKITKLKEELSIYSDRRILIKNAFKAIEAKS